jgi:hypothetical protein
VKSNFPLCAAASPEQLNKDEREQSGEVSEAAEALTPPHHPLPQLALGKLLLFDLKHFYSKAKRH